MKEGIKNAHLFYTFFCSASEGHRGLDSSAVNVTYALERAARPPSGGKFNHIPGTNVIIHFLKSRARAHQPNCEHHLILLFTALFYFPLSSFVGIFSVPLPSLAGDVTLRLLGTKIIQKSKSEGPGVASARPAFVPTPATGFRGGLNPLCQNRVTRRKKRSKVKVNHVAKQGQSSTVEERGLWRRPGGAGALILPVLR